MRFSEKNFVYFLLCCGCVTIHFNIAALAAVIPSMASDFSLPYFQVAQINSYYLIPYGLGALLYAPLTRYFSYKSVYVCAMGFYAIASFWCARAATLEQLFWGLVVSGIAAASAIPLGLIIIGELFEKGSRGRLVGLFFSGSFLSSVAGILVSGIAHWRWLFYSPAVLGVLLSVAVICFRSQHFSHVRSAKVNYLQALRVPQVRWVLLFIFILSFLYHGVHKWYGVFLAREYGLNKFAISLFFLLVALSGAVGQNIGGWLSDKKGRFVACLTGILLLGIFTALLVGHYPLYFLAVILSLIAVGWTIGHNGISTVLTDFPDHHRSEIASLNSAIRFISGGIGFYVSSLFVQLSFQWTFLGIGFLMLLAIGVLWKVVPASQ